ncbi:MAG: methyltransferase domain-containing protein [Nocardioides sp.]
MTGRPRIFVTVGMGSWPFDRLLEGIRPLCAAAEVFAQTGTSGIALPCESAAFLDADEAQRRLRDADIVITHAGNTVRLAQRAGRVPIAVAREKRYGEMGNDHQVAYLRHEELNGRVVGVWDIDTLPEVVATHREAARRLMSRPLPAPANADELARKLDQLVRDLRAERRPVTGWTAPAVTDATVPVVAGPVVAGAAAPFRDHPLRRFAFAWERLAELDGPHLDVGVGLGEFAGPLSDWGREVHGVDVHPRYLAEVRRVHPDVRVARIDAAEPLPYPAATFTSVSLLDVLEHAADEDFLLREVARVLQPGGRLVLSVPHRHVFSVLDPDDAKFRWPRLHRLLYVAAFGAEEYHRRFVDLSDGLRGDMAVNRDRHTNYRTGEVARLVDAAGLEIIEIGGANLFWRWFQIPSLFLRGRPKALLARAIALDGKVFRSPRISANLFIVARRGS